MNNTSTLRVVIGLVLLGAVVGCGDAERTAEDSQPAPPRQTGPPAPTPEVIDAMVQAVERDPADADAHHRLALALHQAGRREESIGHFEVLAQLKPVSQHVVELGVAYASVGRTEEAEATLRRALEMTPDQPTILHHLANLARNRGDVEQAIALYDQALEIDPGYLMARYHLAETQRMSQQFREAYRSYEQVLEPEPENAIELQTVNEALFQLGSLDLQMGATERAVQFFETLAERAPEHPRVHRALGEALMRLGRNEEAQTAFETHRRLITQAGG